MITVDGCRLQFFVYWPKVTTLYLGKVCVWMEIVQHFGSIRTEKMIANTLTISWIYRTTLYFMNYDLLYIYYCLLKCEATRSHLWIVYIVLMNHVSLEPLESNIYIFYKKMAGREKLVSWAFKWSFGLCLWLLFLMGCWRGRLLGFLLHTVSNIVPFTPFHYLPTPFDGCFGCVLQWQGIRVSLCSSFNSHTSISEDIKSARTKMLGHSLFFPFDRFFDFSNVWHKE